MLRISKLADYSTVIMVYLAKAKALKNVTEITHSTGLTKPTVSKLVKRLVTARLLISELGSKGGYRLARSCELITVSHIINAIEQRSGLTECSDEKSQCALQFSCQISQHWQLIDKAIDGVLNHIKLSELIQPSSDLHIEPIIRHVKREIL